MAIGDPIVAFGSSKTLEANGASISSGAVVQANDATYSISADGNSWADAEFVLACAFVTTTGIEGRAINLLARPLNIDSTNDAETPEAARPGLYLGSFIVNDVTSTQYIMLNGNGIARDLPPEAEYYLHNDTGQTVSSGWTLKVRARNTIPATS